MEVAGSAVAAQNALPAPFIELSTPISPVPNRYLLPCPCGGSIPISPSQAGGQVRCDCGLEVDIPTLRQLRELPMASSATASTSVWGLRQGVLSLGLIAASVLALGGAWFVFVEPPAPPPFDAVARGKAVNTNLDQLSPAETWEIWTSGYKPLATYGLQPMKTLRELQVLRRIEVCQWYRNRLFTASAVVFAATLVLYSLIPR